jgi:hypothetical protein
MSKALNASLTLLLAIVAAVVLVAAGADYGYTTAQIEYANRGGCPTDVHPQWPKGEDGYKGG